VNKLENQKILIFVGWFLPGYKGGGPIQSINNLVNLMHEKYDFYLIANDRDFGDTEPYKGIEKNIWINKSSYNIMYINYNKISYRLLKKLIFRENFNTVYLNSFFSARLNLIVLTFMRVFRLKGKIIIAPRGQFLDGAYKIKHFKKYVYKTFFRLFFCKKNLIWHSTSKIESISIKKIISRKSKIIYAPNFTNLNRSIKFKSIKKREGYLNIIFISRIHKKKNLLMALNTLKFVDGNVIFNIYGPIEDNDYWKSCQDVIKVLRENITVNYYGSIAHNNVITVLQQNHILFFPTFSENYGHVIIEALQARRPVVISNQTPWNDLNDFKAGYAISLDEIDRFIQAINYYVTMSDIDFKQVTLNCAEYVRVKFDIPQIIDFYDNLLRERENI